MKEKLLLCAAIAALLVPACNAADNPWNGTWKLNAAKSHLTGDTFTLTALPNGGFHLSEGGGAFQIDYTCDGKDYVVFGNRTGTCKKVDNNHYEMAGKLGGKPDWHGTSVISVDGKYMTNAAYEVRPDGTNTTESNTYERIGTGTGRAGTWKNVKISESAPDIMKITLDGDTMRTESPAYKIVTIAKLDGSLARMEGPTLPPDMTLRMKAEGASKIHFVSTFQGKPSGEGIQTLSADGKTLTVQDWDPGKPDQKQTHVYEKQ